MHKNRDVEATFEVADTRNKDDSIQFVDPGIDIPVSVEVYIPATTTTIYNYLKPNGDLVNPIDEGKIWEQILLNMMKIAEIEVFSMGNLKG